MATVVFTAREALVSALFVGDYNRTSRFSLAPRERGGGVPPPTASTMPGRKAGRGYTANSCNIRLPLCRSTRRRQPTRQGRCYTTQKQYLSFMRS
jgi:hypothetical protein